MLVSVLFCSLSCTGIELWACAPSCIPGLLRCLLVTEGGAHLLNCSVGLLARDPRRASLL